MTITRHNLELEKVAQQYRTDGYRVIIEPGKDERPGFLGDFQPDLIAYGDGESVVVEVKTRPELADNHRLSYVAARINDEPGWRFDLVVTPEENSTEDLTERSAPEIRELVTAAERLIDLKENDAAHLVAWSALEASLRSVLQKEGIDFDRKNSRYLIDTLYSHGMLSRPDYDQLLEAMRVRNAIAHGFKASEASFPSFLIRMIGQLLDQKPSASAA